MSESSPYDGERATYPRAAPTRLVLCADAVRTAPRLDGTNA